MRIIVGLAQQQILLNSQATRAQLEKDKEELQEQLTALRKLLEETQLGGDQSRGEKRSSSRAESLEDFEMVEKIEDESTLVDEPRKKAKSVSPPWTPRGRRSRRGSPASV